MVAGGSDRRPTIASMPKTAKTLPACMSASPPILDREPDGRLDALAPAGLRVRPCLLYFAGNPGNASQGRFGCTKHPNSSVWARSARLPSPAAILTPAMVVTRIIGTRQSANALLAGEANASPAGTLGPTRYAGQGNCRRRPGIPARRSTEPLDAVPAQDGRHGRHGRHRTAGFDSVRV